MRIFCKVLGLLAIIFSTGCVASLSHRTSAKLAATRVTSASNIVVANLGDSRPEAPDSIGQGVSYWLPTKVWAADRSGQRLMVGHYLADSFRSDLSYVGFKANLINQDQHGISLDEAKAAAAGTDASFLVTFKTLDAKTNYWGFLLIPFMEPVWTRITYDVGIYEPKSGSQISQFTIRHKETEWYFAKVTIFDAIFDSALLGRRWHRKAWGSANGPISDGLALGVLRSIPVLETSKAMSETNPQKPDSLPLFTMGSLAASKAGD